MKKKICAILTALLIALTVSPTALADTFTGEDIPSFAREQNEGLYIASQHVTESGYYKVVPNETEEDEDAADYKLEKVTTDEDGAPPEDYQIYVELADKVGDENKLTLKNFQIEITTPLNKIVDGKPDPNQDPQDVLCETVGTASSDSGDVIQTYDGYRFVTAGIAFLNGVSPTGVRPRWEVTLVGENSISIDSQFAHPYRNTSTALDVFGLYFPDGTLTITGTGTLNAEIKNNQRSRSEGAGNFNPACAIYAAAIELGEIIGANNSPTLDLTTGTDLTWESYWGENLLKAILEAQGLLDSYEDIKDLPFSKNGNLSSDYGTITSTGNITIRKGAQVTLQDNLNGSSCLLADGQIEIEDSATTVKATVTGPEDASAISAKDGVEISDGIVIVAAGKEEGLYDRVCGIESSSGKVYLSGGSVTVNAAAGQVQDLSQGRADGIDGEIVEIAGNVDVEVVTSGLDSTGIRGEEALNITRGDMITVDSDACGLSGRLVNVQGGNLQVTAPTVVDGTNGIVLTTGKYYGGIAVDGGISTNISGDAEIHGAIQVDDDTSTLLVSGGKFQHQIPERYWAPWLNKEIQDSVDHMYSYIRYEQEIIQVPSEPVIPPDQPDDPDNPSEPEGPGVADPDDTGVSDWLITDEHIAYLSGYPGSLFMPNSDMTRAEAAQMFYNLLVNKNVPVTVGFADVPEDEWYAEAVNTLASLGILEGVGENRFEPQRAITRAEFTAIAMRFTNGVPGGENIFPDVSPDEWYYDYVVGAIQYGWIDGYPSGYFGPEDTITRAEVTTIVNRMLARSADEGYVDSHADRLVQFIDLTDAHWAYYQIMEAANGHTYTITDGEETWTGLH